MKEIRIKIYGWSDLKKWCRDKLCFSRRKLVAEWLDYYSCEERNLVEEFLLKYNKQDLKKNDYAALSEALKDWDREIKKIRDETETLIMMK